MGTNFYAYRKPDIQTEEYLELAQLAERHDAEGIDKWLSARKEKFENARIHIGKSSYGWRFLFNHNNWKYYDYSRESINAFLESCDCIYNEYDEKITIEEFWLLVDSKKSGFTGKQYHENEVKRAEEKEKGLIEDRFDLIPTLSQALKSKALAAARNYGEELYYDNKLIPYSALGYRFANTVEFC